jgi:hypothetical protein
MLNDLPLLIIFHGVSYTSFLTSSRELNQRLLVVVLEINLLTTVRVLMGSWFYRPRSWKHSSIV